LTRDWNSSYFTAATLDNPMANLLLTILKAADIPATQFADSTGRSNNC
jgi:hypothetical protein